MRKGCSNQEQPKKENSVIDFKDALYWVSWFLDLPMNTRNLISRFDLSETWIERSNWLLHGILGLLSLLKKKVIYVVAEKMKVPHMKSSFIQDSSCAIGKGFFSKNNSNTSVKIQPLLYLAVLALQCLQLKISLTLVRWEVSVVGLTPSFSYYLPTCF